MNAIVGLAAAPSQQDRNRLSSFARRWIGLRDTPTSLAFLLILLLVLQGCMTPVEPRLGDHVTLRPGWSKLQRAGGRALEDPNVWATFLGAALLQIDGLDRELSDRARENTPLFGSTESALQASEDLASLGDLGYVTTALLVPGPESPGDWFGNKAKLLGSEWLAVELTGETATAIKGYTQRERPNGENEMSLPSYDATSAAIRSHMANLNVAHLPIDEDSKTVLNFGLDSIGVLAAWSRVEAGKHYPSDVLVGWALGSFFGHIANEFIDPDTQNLQIAPQFLEDGAGVQLMLRF